MSDGIEIDKQAGGLWHCSNKTARHTLCEQVYIQVLDVMQVYRIYSELHLAM